MQIKYVGPSPSVIVHPYGVHMKDKVREYPDDFGEELLATSHKQNFEQVGGQRSGAGSGGDEAVDPEKMTVAQLAEELGGNPDGLKKAELVEQVKAKRDDGSD